ncbi:ThuA domain-containing protein [Georgenia satyanarayanai]|uniref:ThuA domain-containing protein n=1 Tax=Georgenia satyanarayanai TaxID=860221 RepID=UPI001263FE9E|nr:ThuA domain-containing protein [Georgenia satyanarayanai]
MSTSRPGWGRTVASVAVSALGLSLLTALPASAAIEPEHDIIDTRGGDRANVLVFTATAAWRHGDTIDQGTPLLMDSFEEAGIGSVWTEDSSIFTDEDLAQFDALVMFQTSGDPWTADEKEALESYQQAGGGIVAIHNATDMRGDYEWWDNLIGALMPGHAATGTDPGLPGTVRVEDRAHPSTEHLPQRWERADEWYNFSANVRGEAHVLATMDETTYEPGGNAMGYDHPISWCKLYDGGRAWATGMGHFPSHFEEPALLGHILGGVEWAAGLAEGDCGGTNWDMYERVALDQNTSAPFGMDIADDGRVFFTELVRGQVRVYDPQTHTTTTALELDVYSGGEDGLLGIALDPGFAENGHLYLYYSPASEDDTDPANFFSLLSRFTMDHETGIIEPETERVLLEVPARRLPDEPGHTGGVVEIDADGNLFLGVGDDVNPHSEPSGGYAPISERDGQFHDARATSANTNDLRGKILRITPLEDIPADAEPGIGSTYTVPEGNMFDESEDTEDKTLPEIYAMGFRNPFQFAIDEETGNLSLADYSPDNGSDAPATRGPAGIAEWMLIEEPGFYGWPLCMGDNEPFRDVDYRTNPVTVGEFFDCDAPVNDSIHNTGLTELPPAKAPDMWYGYQRASHPEIVTQGGGLAPMGGPFYHFDAELESDTKFPEYFDGQPFFFEWARNKMYSLLLSEDGTELEKVNAFLPSEPFMAPIEAKFGPDGSMYVLDWGGGFGRHNPDSGLHRIDYVSGSRSPSAVATATPDSGQAPLEVTFDGSDSSDPENEELSYAWDFDGDGETDSTEVSPTTTYEENGVYDARLTVTDPHGKTGTTTVPVTVGNTRPEISFNLPPDGAFFDFGDEISWDIEASDAEEEIADEDIIVQPALGHDAHSHPAEPFRGRTGTVATSLGGGHSDDMNVFYVLDARYTDSGGDGVPALTGQDTSLLFGKIREAEFYAESDGVTAAASRDVEGHGTSISGQGGAWASYDPVNLINIDRLLLRVASATGGEIELRRGAPDGELLATAEIPSTGGLSRYTDVAVEVTDPGETFELYVVFPGEGERRLNFIEADGKGVSPTTKPRVSITAPTGAESLEPGEITVTAEAADAENEITQVEFFVGDESIGVDDEAPYGVTWDAAEESVFQLTAVATNDNGVSTTSRIVPVTVGEPFGDFSQFTNARGEFSRGEDGSFVITSGGANMWNAVDEYSSLYLPAGADENWSATVKVVSQGNSHNSAKAGLIVRNDITAPGQSAGYAALGIRPSGGFEWLRSANGNGQLNASTGAGSTAYPAWMRIVRDGDQYTAFHSTNGEDFAQIGQPVTLPGAASVQDLGLFVTAHHATATSEVVFSDFVFDDDPVVPDPDPDPEPGPGPVCPVPMSDEFDGESLDAHRWTTVRGDVSVAEGGLRLPVTTGDIDGANTGPISFVGQPVPSGEWQVDTHVTLAHERHWQYSGLMLHSGDDDYTKLTFTRHQDGSRFLEYWTESGGSRTQHADNVTLPDDAPASVHLRLSSDGEDVTAAYSLDGEEFTTLDGSATLDPEATVGVVAAGDTGAGGGVAVVDHVRVTPDREDDGGEREPSDEFEGDALDGCRWDATVRYNAENVSVADGELHIVTAPGDINNDNPDSPENFILQSAPEGDWTVETRFHAPLHHQWQYAGLLAYGDDDEYVKLDVVARNAPGAALDLGAELVAEVDGSFGAGGNRSVDLATEPEGDYWHLRLSRTGDSYAGWVSEDGETWTSLGDPVTHAGDLSSVGLVAIGPDQTEPTTVSFDYFRVVDGDVEPPVDEDAPTVSGNVLGTSFGEFTRSGHGGGTLDIGGTATFRKTATGTAVSVRVTGLLPGQEYASHLHDGSCMDHGGHYMHDPSGPAAPPNEIWASSSNDVRGNLVPNRNGIAVGSGSATWVARQEPLSIMVHDSEPPGLPIACADFAAYEAPASLVAQADDGEGSGVETIEYSLDGGEWVTFDGAVPVSEPGAHTAAFRATDAAGNTSEVHEIEFRVAGEVAEPVEVTPEAVTFTDEDGTEDDTFTVPAVEGVEYVVDGEVVPAGTHPGSGTVTVTARAVEGYVLADGATTEWEHTFSTAGGEPPACEPGEVEDGYRALFDGTAESLAQWRMAGPGSFELQEDCSMLSVGGMGLLWHPEELGSYSLKLDWMMDGDDNSGVFVGFPDPGDDPWVAVNEGYEIQIDATDEDDRTTGAIYTFQSADLEARDEALNPPGEWNSYEIVVEGQNIKVFLNEVLVNDFDSTHPDRDLTSGFIGLQNHGEGDDVYFRNVRVADLDDTDPEPVEVTPAAVTFTDEDGTEDDTFTIPAVEGVEYLVDGEVVPAGTYPGVGTVEVTARATEGFVLAEGAVAEWSFTFSTAGQPQPDRRTAEFHLSNTWRGSTDVYFMYGRWADEVLIGDWDGDGVDTIAVRRGNVFHVSNAQQGGDADVVLTYGRPGDVILVGDWNGDGTDTFAVRRGNEYHVKNSLRGGDADSVFRYGRAGDQVLVGDWDGNGTDTFAVRRGATYHVKNSLRGGDADVVFTYGRSGDVVLAGDWNADGRDTFAVRRGATYHVNNSLRGGDADRVVTFGRAGDEVHVGDWDGNGSDTLGVRRPVGAAPAPAAAGAKEVRSVAKLS